MKKFLTAVAMALLLVGCTRETVDLSGINEKLAELDNRVSALEGAIASIQSAIGDGVFVQKVEQYADPETGKTIGVTVTYTSGKVVYFEISPKADYSGPVLGVIRSGSGSLVWAVDGIAIKDAEGNEVPVNKTPVFTIDEDGYLWVSIDGGDPVKLGQVKSEGASLVDGIFKDIKVEQDKVVLVLSDDSIVNIPFAEAFKLVIEGTEFLNDGGKAITIPYSVTAKTTNTVVDVTGYDPTCFYVQVTDENIIITPLMSWVSTKMLIYADSKVGLVSMVNIEVAPGYASVIDPIADPDTYSNYVAEGDGDSIEMHVVSNMEIDAVPDEGSKWITITSTKSTTYTITATIDKNTDEEARIGHVFIYKKGTDKYLQTIQIYQAKGTAGPVNLSKKGASNSYIVTKPGTYTFAAVKGNSVESVGTVAKAELIWETNNTATAPEANSIIAKLGINGNYIIFSTPETLVPGNALIAAKDASDNILWSWHIWIPATTISEDSYGDIFGAVAMDRNLGALTVAEAGESAVNVTSFGLMYQWGRKDPFPNAAEQADKPAMAAVTKNATTKAEGTITLEQSIANPTLMGFTSNGDWITTSDDNLWKDEEKTIYDPCPVGYRVPIKNGEKTFWSDDLSKGTGWAESSAGGWFKLGDPVAVMPFAGYIDDDGLTFKYSGKRALYWTSHRSGSVTSYGTDVRVADRHKLSSPARARAGSVRCVAEKPIN